MNRTLSAVAFLTILCTAASPIFALPPIDKEWKERYIETVPPPPFKGQAQMEKCNVCHAGMAKKMKNEYGNAVGKYINKAGVNALKGNEAALKKYIQDGLQKAEEEKNADGKSFGDVMNKDGKLPAAK